MNLEKNSNLFGKIEFNLPIITIITSTYNAVNYLPSTLESIRKQNYINLQYIIIDGGSNDGTIDLLKSNEDIINYWISEPDTGIYNAWNKGLFFAKGKWILFLGAGDLLVEGWLQLISEVKNDVDLVYANLKLYKNLPNLKNGKLIKSQKWETALFELPNKMTLPHPGMAHNSKLFQNDKYDESYKIVGDWAFLVKSKLKKGYYYENQLQTYMLIGGMSKSPGNVKRHYEEILRVYKIENKKMLMSIKIKWILKKYLSNYPKLFESLQELYIIIKNINFK